jgi:hypothetical protein
MHLFLWIGTAPASVGTSGNKGWWEGVDGRVSIGKGEFVLGEPIFVNVVLSNHHTEPISVSDAVYRSFEFSVVDSPEPRPRKLRNPDPSGLFRTISVPPGGTLGDTAFIGEYIDIREPGVYTIGCRGSVLVWKVSQTEEDLAERSILISATVVVKVRRGSQDELETALRDHLEHLRSADRSLQRQGARALAVSRPDLAIKLLQEAIGGKPLTDPVALARAAWALARVGTNEAIQALSEAALNSPDEGIRVPIVIELGRSNIAVAVPLLTQLLSDPSPNVRVAALNALEGIGDKSTIPAVQSKLADSDARVREVAGRVVQNLTAREKSAPIPRQQK